MASRGSSLTWPHRVSWARLSCTEYGFDSLGNRWLWCPQPSRTNGLRWLTWAHWLCTQRRGFNLRASCWSDRRPFLRGCAWPCSWTFRRSTVRNGRTGPNPTRKFRWLSCRKCRQSLGLSRQFWSPLGGGRRTSVACNCLKLSRMRLNSRRDRRFFCPFVQRSQVRKRTSRLQREREALEIGIFSGELERENEWNESFSKIKKREVRVFWSELKWGGNGGERKRNCRSKKSFFFFPGK